ncbi:MAG: hypothetical protein Q9196_003615 [Gyalolechia fulgens]
MAHGTGLSRLFEDIGDPSMSYRVQAPPLAHVMSALMTVGLGTPAKPLVHRSNSTYRFDFPRTSLSEAHSWQRLGLLAWRAIYILLEKRGITLTKLSVQSVLVAPFYQAEGQTVPCYGVRRSASSSYPDLYTGSVELYADDMSSGTG